jgi:hypothetical protein
MTDTVKKTRSLRPIIVVPERRGWRINQWAHTVGVSRAYVYASLLDTGRIESVKVGRARIITTSPDEFLASMPRA